MTREPGAQSQAASIPSLFHASLHSLVPVSHGTAPVFILPSLLHACAFLTFSSFVYSPVVCFVTFTTKSNAQNAPLGKPCRYGVARFAFSAGTGTQPPGPGKMLWCRSHRLDLFLSAARFFGSQCFHLIATTIGNQGNDHAELRGKKHLGYLLL